MKDIKKYPEYKDSMIDWLGEIPTNWLISPIGRVGTVKSSKRIFENQYSNDGIPFFRSKEIVELANHKNISADIFIPIKLYDEIVAINGSPQKGNLLITSIGTIGEVWISDGREFYYKDGNITQLNVGGKLNSEFTFYCFKSLLFKEQYGMMSAGSTLMALTIEKIKQLVILLPSLKEQKSIAHFLDKKTFEIDILIEDKENLIKLLEEKLQAIITEAVTKGLNPDVKMKESNVEWIGKIPEHWKVKKLKRCFKVINGKEIERELEKDNPTAIDVFGSGGVFKKTDKSIYEGESVLFGRKGTIGKVIFVNQSFWTVDTMYWTRFYEESFPKWFYYMLSAFPWSVHATKTALPSIVGTDIENEVWSIPPYEEQVKITSYLDSKMNNIMDLKSDIKKQIEKLKEYRQSLIFEAVTGKIDVRNYGKLSS